MSEHSVSRGVVAFFATQSAGANRSRGSDRQEVKSGRIGATVSLKRRAQKAPAAKKLLLPGASVFVGGL